MKLHMELALRLYSLGHCATEQQRHEVPKMFPLHASLL